MTFTGSDFSVLSAWRGGSLRRSGGLFMKRCPNCFVTFTSVSARSPLPSGIDLVTVWIGDHSASRALPMNDIFAFLNTLTPPCIQFAAS